MTKKATDRKAPITFTFTVDPDVILKPGQPPAMSVSLVAKQGDAAHMARFEMTDWRADIGEQVDRLMRAFLSGDLAPVPFPEPQPGKVDPPDDPPDDPQPDPPPDEPADVSPPEPVPDDDPQYEITLIQPGQPIDDQLKFFN